MFTKKQRGQINIAKLVLWNLTQPFEKRIAADDLQERVNNAPYRGRLASLREQVRSEVSGILAANQAKEDALMAL